MTAQPHHHDHAHDHSPSHNPQRLLFIVLTLNVAYMFAEALGGWWANSLALLSDAGHMFADVAALSLSLLAARFAARPATPNKTYGYYRMEILAALANGVTLIGVSLLICYEAYHRLQQAEPIQAKIMIPISIGGLIVNLISAKVLHGAHEHDLNLRGAFLHVHGRFIRVARRYRSRLIDFVAGMVVGRPHFQCPDLHPDCFQFVAISQRSGECFIGRNTLAYQYSSG